MSLQLNKLSPRWRRNDTRCPFPPLPERIRLADSTAAHTGSIGFTISVLVTITKRTVYKKARAWDRQGQANGQIAALLIAPYEHSNHWIPS